ncbi:hypothetical protein FRC06_006945, partial [Ceratobasidium sp. 370]
MFQVRALPLSLLAISAQLTAAAFVDYTLNIVNAQIAPDGFTRSASLVNGQFPGTVLFDNKGDVLRNTVVNKLTDPSMRRSTTIHWHGLYQRTTAYGDGPAFVTQCRIAPAASYQYVIPTLDQAGTRWPVAPWSVINVEKGKRYRFRVIDDSALGHFKFEIDGHPLRIIEADGLPHQLVVVKFVEIHPGERYSIVPVENPGAPGGSATADVFVDLKYGGVSGGATGWQVNDSQYKSPSLPTLLKILSNNATKNSDFARSENTIVLPFNKVVELRIHGSSNGFLHPWHLHGHSFDIIQNGGAANYVDPPRKDVVPVGGGTAIIRFKTSNPGPWFLHCHVDWHLE